MPLHFLVLLPFFLAGCTGEGGAEAATSAGRADEVEPPQRVVRHPVADSLLSNATHVPVHDLRFEELAATLPPRLGVLTRFPEDGAIGSLNDEPGPVLGVIVDATVLPGVDSPWLAVLDESYGIVRMFAADGTVRSSFGGLGAGPGEFRRPVAVEHENGTVLVLDAGRKVERYAVADSTWEPGTPVRIPIDGQDICMTERGLLVVGTNFIDQAEPGTPADPRALHLISPEAEEVAASFSAPYRHSAIGPLFSLTRGRLACNREHGLVWIAYSILHEVHALNAGGDLRWIVRLTDESYPDILEHPDGRFGEDPQHAGASDRITHVSLLGSSLLAVQVTSRAFGESRGEHTDTYRTYLIEAETGRGVGAFQADHQVIGGGGDRAVLYRENPFPRVAAVDIR